MRYCQVFLIGSLCLCLSSGQFSWVGLERKRLALCNTLYDSGLIL